MLCFAVQQAASQSSYLHNSAKNAYQIFFLLLRLPLLLIYTLSINSTRQIRILRIGGWILLKN